MEVINGDLAVDDRGTVSFVNNFDFKDVKRFYLVSNHSKGFVRAWHGHEREGKYVFVAKGSCLVRFVPLNGLNEDVKNKVLSDKQPSILFIPPGYANGFKTLTDDALVMFFSTSTLAESGKDDIRFPANKWGGEKGWQVEER